MLCIMNNSKFFRFQYRKLFKKWSSINSIRSKSSVESKKKTYSHTILTPKTNFPARSSNAKKEDIQKTAQFSELYNWQREHLTGEEFVLHDGPPYANGDLHMGHAVNKIIKDVNNRNQVLQGNRVHYTPGWDCHGLPIELKALQKAKRVSKQNAPNDPIQIRKLARAFAMETVEKQKAAFESWGVMADWNNCYLTLHNSYVQKQLRQFYKMYRSGLIYRGLKPVYWSPSSRTALAEAELEYDPQYKSNEVYVTFPIQNVPQILRDTTAGRNIFAIIWTTTPWTLVANKAICYSPQLKYSLVSISSRPGDLFIVCSTLVESLENILGAEINKVVEFDGHQLENTTYINRLVGETLPFLEGHHVTDSKGTGLVHTAPAHGPEDFLVALKNNMTVQCNVDESGRYTNLTPDFNGLPVLSEGQELVIDHLGDSVLHRGVYIHSYPLDWRTKKPVIVRASQQWFVDTAALKENALASLDNVRLLPTSSAEQSRQGFRSQLERRPYWCISRQRAWGVPIPVLYCGDEVIVDERIIEKLCSLIEKDSPDVWWNCDVQELLSDEVIRERRLDVKGIVKGQDIMDIWFDSGISWTTLEGSRADLYSEGYDQLTGWFQTSLLTSVALTGNAPYRSIFVHGFVVDDKKRKMSKSIGNIIEPATVIHGGKDKNNQPVYGVDTLRWWVASHATQHSQIVISKKLLDDCQSEVIRIRSILKYLLGVISDLKKMDFDKKPTLNYLDEYILGETHDFLQQTKDNYNNFRYNHIAQSVLFFISNKVSALYCHCIKDRLYCSHKGSNERLSAQLVVHTILVSLCKSLGPILPHLIEEAWQHHPLYEKPFYFTERLSVLPPKTVDTSLMVAMLELKRDICLIAKNENLKKFNVNIKLHLDLYGKLKELNNTDGINDSVLCEILEVSAVDLEVRNGGGNWQIELSESARSQCLRCRKYNALDNSDKCWRCEEVVNSLSVVDIL